MHDSLTINAPAPLKKYRGKIEIAPENMLLLSGQERARKLDKKELARAKKELQQLDKTLDTIYPLLPAWDGLRAELNSAKLNWFNLESEFNRISDPARKQQLKAQGKIILENSQSIKADLDKLYRLLKPFKVEIRRANQLRAAIESHNTALQDEKLDRELTKRMDQEARLTGALIIEALSRLGYRHKITRRDGFGAPKTFYKLVRFERIVVTPDTIAYKVDVSRLGLLDGIVDNLPHGVKAADLYKQETLTELSIATERIVTSPNIDDPDNCPASKGVWYVVHRLGLSDGVPEMVRYRDVMSRYPEDKSHLLPLPMGVKPGRHINWTYLAKQPHLMVNGVTGFGKSNTMRMVLATLVSRQSPELVRYVTIDMKNQGDFAEFEKLPHCIASVNDIEGAAKLINQLFLEMKRRQEVIRRFTNDISKYNQMVAAPDRLPHILIVFDEYPAIWVKKELAKLIDEFAAQIAIQGRASGIHLFIGGQQAYSGDINRLIVANITHRYTSRQNTVGASMSTTGDRSAQKLRPVPGRFLCTTDSDNSYVVQMPMIEDHEITEAVAASQQWEKARPVVLPELSTEDKYDDYADETPKPTINSRELVLKTAMDRLEGNLKARIIWEILGKTISLPQVTKICEQLSKNPIEYEGILYEPVKVRNYYQFCVAKAAAAD
jgi:hypothetical protein